MHSSKIIKYNFEREKNIRTRIVANFSFLFISDSGMSDWLTNIP